MTLSFESGKIYGPQGPNGSGKTMLMRLVAGLIRPTRGEVLIDGKRLGHDIDFPPFLGLLIENPALLPTRWNRLEKIPLYLTVSRYEDVHLQ